MKRWKTATILILALIVFIALCILVGRAQAAPYLASDPQQNISYYEVQRDVKDLAGNVTTITEQSQPQAVAGGVRFHYDLFGLPIGQHTMRVIAVRIENRDGGGTYARSDPAPFLYECSSLAGPRGLKLSTE